MNHHEGERDRGDDEGAEYDYCRYDVVAHEAKSTRYAGGPTKIKDNIFENWERRPIGGRKFGPNCDISAQCCDAQQRSCATAW